MKYIVLFLVLIFDVAEARVFKFSSESVGAYFNASGASSSLGQDPFIKSAGANTVIAESFTLHPAFELGMVAIPFNGFSVTLGVQVIQSNILSKIKGNNAGGTELFSLTSSVFALNPKLSIESDMGASETGRFYWHLGVGYSDITLDQSYIFTAAGKSALSLTVDDYVEKSSAFALSYTAGLGYEFLAVDNVTMNIELGYRQLPVTDLTYKNAYSELIQAPSGVSAGDTVRNTDGTKRSFDFGGGYIGIGFRFYINTI